ACPLFQRFLPTSGVDPALLQIPASLRASCAVRVPLPLRRKIPSAASQGRWLPALRSQVPVRLDLRRIWRRVLPAILRRAPPEAPLSAGGSAGWAPPWGRRLR